MRVSVLLCLLVVAGCGTSESDPIVIDTGSASGDDVGLQVDSSEAADVAVEVGQVDMGADASPDADASSPADSWENFAQTWFADFCVRCHGGGSARDYTTRDHVERDDDRIRCGVAPTLPAGCSPASFPANAPFPDDDQRDRLVAWIDAGLL